jgi:2-methylcitrate dehydratase
MGIVVKSGPLHNPADRDHCLQYVIAVGLVHGALGADHFEDEIAADPRIDWLREKMRVAASDDYSRDFYVPDKRSSANSVQIRFKDGSATPRIEVEYPMGHPRRRAEGLAMVARRFRANIGHHYAAAQAERIVSLCLDVAALAETPVPMLMDLLAVDA